MDNDKIETLLLQLVQDVSYIKARLEVLETVQNDCKELNNRIDKLEADDKEHTKSIEKLEHRASATEEFIREKMSETNKTQKGVFISLGLAVFSAVVSFVMNLL